MKVFFSLYKLKLLPIRFWRINTFS